ncbi:hypothetical protein PIB30_045481 [Stylosanthes scabra]|uniref:Uncharacterized protein n=1 Tax=Stylosanthes scabra TaxID=79078 RepID=A0ABU6WFV9_9FABA|nr:hypothetical protein [Stylosanthes scabra]
MKSDMVPPVNAISEKNEALSDQLLPPKGTWFWALRIDPFKSFNLFSNVSNIFPRIKVLINAIAAATLSVMSHGQNHDAFPCRLVDPPPMRLQAVLLPSLFASSFYLVFFGSGGGGNSDVFSSCRRLLFLLPNRWLSFPLLHLSQNPPHSLSSSPCFFCHVSLLS